MTILGRARELERIYGVIEKEIMNNLLLIDVGNYQEVKVVKAQEKIEELIKMLNRSAMEWAKTAIPEVYDRGREVAETRLEILGAEQNEEFSKKTHEQSIERETEETIDFLIRANLSVKLNVATYFYIISQAAHRIMQIQEFDFRDEAFISELLDDAIIAGETRIYAKNLVMDHIKSEVGEGKFIQIRGRNYNMKKYADTVAKTRLRTVQTESVLNSCKEYDNDLVEVSSHGTDCIICETYEGGIYSLSGKHTTYPYLDFYPPWHPRCQHHIRPTSEEALKARGKRAPTPPTRGKVNFRGNVTDAERAVIQGWSDKDYMMIRKYLRAGEIERGNMVRQFGAQIKTNAETMERLFKKYIDGMTERTLHRGLGKIPEEVYNKFKGYKVGDTAIIDKSITSWSTNPLVAGDFADQMGYNMRFYLEKGRKNTLELDIKKISGKIKESEVIVNTHKFEITRIREEVYAPVPQIVENILHVYLREIRP